MATRERAHRRVVLLLVACSVGLIPWTIGLAVTLPRDYLVGNWALAWTGFDVVLIGCFAFTGWSLWKQRQHALPAAIATSVLLLCDAWFDLLTAHGGSDFLVSTITALFGEIPLAILLAVIAARLLAGSWSVETDVHAYIYLTDAVLLPGRDSISCDKPDDVERAWAVMDWREGRIVGLEVLDASKLLHADLWRSPTEIEQRQFRKSAQRLE